MHDAHGHMLLGRNLDDIVFGAEDGLVSILGVVTGLAVAGVSAPIVLLGGIAAALSGAISMGAGTYLGSKSQSEYIARERRREVQEMRRHPEHLRKEMKKILSHRVERDGDLDSTVEYLCEDEDLCTTIILEHEGLPVQADSVPVRAAVLMFISYIVATIIPVGPYIFLSTSQALLVSIGGTIVALFGVGVAKTFLTDVNWLRSGMEMLLVGSAAGLAGYLIGLLFNLGPVA